ncbi:hypothetical protein DSLASN_28870 [Desulfoluna limicola]|uniref:Uncharacterized protein n=1 Tax=Desulfoluna limicola TaxID=2810562 RepID=A0ABM7PIN9_9BACT|nr:hypothetical protein DSLASN_28870 [Desulfoluna limicola]
MPLRLAFSNKAMNEEDKAVNPDSPKGEKIEQQTLTYTLHCSNNQIFHNNTPQSRSIFCERSGLR